MALFLIAILMGLCTSAVSVLQAWIETFNRNGIIHIMKSVFSLAARRTSVAALAPKLGAAPVS
jgi:hypothetical protein